MPSKGSNKIAKPRPEPTENIMEIPLTELYPFKDHPFQVRNDEEMKKMAESVSEYGVLVPAIARPREGGGYELISGHRRRHACELAGKKNMPVIVRKLDDDSAVIMMTDSNLQRENILPSERAKAYKMKMDAIKRQGARNDLISKQEQEKSTSDDSKNCQDPTSAQIEQKLEKGNKDHVKSVITTLKNAQLGAREQVAQDAGESAAKIQRYIRLTSLIPELLDMVDTKKIAFSPAVELSYLNEQEQRLFLDAMNYAQAVPSLSQAQRLKKLSREGKCTQEVMRNVMSEVKKDDLGEVRFKTEDLRKYFPKSYTPKQMGDTILRLLDQWQRRKQKEKER